MAYIVMAYKVMAHIVMAYKVMAQTESGPRGLVSPVLHACLAQDLYSYGIYSYGTRV